MLYIDIVEDNAFSLYDVYGYALAQEPLPRFTPKWQPLGLRGHEIYNFYFPYTTDETYQIWLRLVQSSWEEDVNGLLTTHDDERQPTAILVTWVTQVT